METCELPTQWGAAAVVAERFERRWRPGLAALRHRTRRLGPAPQDPAPGPRPLAQLRAQVQAARTRLAREPPPPPAPTTPPPPPALLQARLDQILHDRVQLLKNRQLFVEEVKNKHKAYLIAKDYYKTKLNMYYSIDGPTDDDKVIVYVQFFTSKKLKSDNNSVTLHRNKSDCSFQLIETHPQLPIFDELRRRLEETGDVVGLICVIRRCFIQCNKS